MNRSHKYDVDERFTRAKDHEFGRMSMESKKAPSPMTHHAVA